MIYIFTNENISAYLSEIKNMRNARVLTVAASGDHVFEAYLAGARHVDTFDYNYLQRHVMELKTVMIHNLPRADFEEFFYCEHASMNLDIIRPLWDKFSPGLKVWLHAFVQNRRKFIYSRQRYNWFMPQYVTDDAKYQQLRECLPYTIPFTHTGVNRVAQKFYGQYDVIMLSNIWAHCTDEKHSNQYNISMFYNQYVEPIVKRNLAPNGAVFFDYQWQKEIHYAEHEREMILKLCPQISQIGDLRVKSCHSTRYTPEHPHDAVLYLQLNNRTI